MKNNCICLVRLVQINGLSVILNSFHSIYVFLFCDERVCDRCSSSLVWKKRKIISRKGQNMVKNMQRRPGEIERNIKHLFKCSSCSSSCSEDACHWQQRQTQSNYWDSGQGTVRQYRRAQQISILFQFDNWSYIFSVVCTFWHKV